MVCDVELVKDQNCEVECHAKTEQLKTKAKVFERFTEALLNLQKRNQKYIYNNELLSFVKFVDLINLDFQKWSTILKKPRIKF